MQSINLIHQHVQKRYSLIKTLTKNFNILSNADADANANADAGVIAIALPVLSYRRAKNGTDLTIKIANFSRRSCANTLFGSALFEQLDTL